MRVPQVSERIKEAPAQALRGVFAGIGQLLLITDKLRNKASAGRDVPRARTPEAAKTVPDPAATSPAATSPAATSPAGQREEAAAAPVVAPVAAPGTAEAVAAGPAAVKPATVRRAPAKPATAKPAAGPAGAKPATARRVAAKPSPAEPAAAEKPKPPKRQSTRNFDKTGNVRLLGDEEDGSALSAPAAAAAAEPVTAAEPAGIGEAAGSPADSAPLPNYDELSVASLRAHLRNLDIAQVRQLADYERAHAARADVLAMFQRRIAKLEAEA
jgi:hypothetical protein